MPQDKAQQQPAGGGSSAPPRAKIVCTLGPASKTPEVIGAMLDAGMNVARLNFSHGSRDDHRQLIETLRRVAGERGRLLGILLDLQGPKVRVGEFPGGPVELGAGDEFTITGENVPGDATRVSTTHTGLSGDVSPGDRILLDDGNIVLKVVQVQGRDVRCEVLVGGTLSNHKGINLPGAALSVETITEKDYADAAFALEQGVDFLAMSFVRHHSDILKMRTYLESRGGSLPIIAKIEKPQALEHIEEIIRVSDGIMVARGDLGVELPPERVPAVQKSIIRSCNEQGRPVITATQMLESMIHHPRPTRAEASDVANAILDGTDAVMLSAESAAGSYPVEAVTVMRRIIQATEASQAGDYPSWKRRRQGQNQPFHQGIAVSATWLAELVGAQALVSITLSGSMALLIARERPHARIFAISHFEQVLRRLTVVWGIEGIYMADLDTGIDQATMDIKNRLLSLGLIEKGDSMVLTAGLPFSERSTTNMVRVDRVE